MISKLKLYTIYIENTEGSDIYFNVIADSFTTATVKANAIFEELSKEYKEGSLSITNVRTADINLWSISLDSAK